MQGSVSKIAVADTANGPVFGAVLTDGTFQAKQGINGGWVTEDGAISAIAFGG